MSKRDQAWLVETDPDTFTTVHGHSSDVEHGGAFVVRDKHGDITVAYSPNAWISVVPAEDNE